MDGLDFITALQRLEGEASRMRLWITKRAINIAIKAYGWEKAGNTKMAAKCLPPPDQNEYSPSRGRL